MGILVAFKMKFWNIGGEGQIIMGALAAAYVALNVEGLPKPVMLLLMGIAAMIAGASGRLFRHFSKQGWSKRNHIYPHAKLHCH